MMMTTNWMMSWTKTNWTTMRARMMMIARLDRPPIRSAAVSHVQVRPAQAALPRVHRA
jgi:hypothetical protein